MRVPLIDLLFLMSILMKTVPDEVKNLKPGQLHDHRTIVRKLFITIPAECNQADAESLGLVVSDLVNVRRRGVDICLREAANCREDTVYIPTVFTRPWAIQGAGLVGFNFDYSDFNKV